MSKQLALKSYPRPLRILHTSDWHLGKNLLGKKDRNPELELFLDWLLETITQEEIDLLIVAGDIFDTVAPSSASQKLYYDFLLRIQSTNCKQVLITAGNHDSPAFIDAPKALLESLNVKVVSHVRESLAEQIMVVRDKEDNPTAIVAAVPYLQERNISQFVAGESYDDRGSRVSAAIKNHYRDLADLAVEKRQELQGDIPLISTGHLAIMGGLRTTDDEVLDTFIGKIQGLSPSIFPEEFDFVCLGHFHIASGLGQRANYSGTPIPMGFGEVGQEKVVNIIEFGEKSQLRRVKIPVFQKIQIVQGDLNFIKKELQKLVDQKADVWLEVVYDGEDYCSILTDEVNSIVKDSLVQVLKITNKQAKPVLPGNEFKGQKLTEFTPKSIFEDLMDKKGVNAEDQKLLMGAYLEILAEVQAGVEQ